MAAISLPWCCPTPIFPVPEYWQKIRSEMEIVNFGQDDGKGPKVTVSVGCANFNMEDLNPETILRDAKLALRRAKDAGRNQIASS